MARRFVLSGLFRSRVLLPLIVVLLSASVALGDTEVTLTSDHPGNTSAIGELVVFTATVTDKADPPGVPTGYVTWKEGDLVLARTRLESGEARFSAAILKVGSHDIQAFYEGEAPFPPSSSATPLTHVVNAASRAVMVEVVLTPNPVTFGVASAVQVNVHDHPGNPSPPGNKGVFTLLAPAHLLSARSGHSSALLPDGTVWIAGGNGGLATSEIYSITAGFLPGPNLTDGADPSPRAGHTATRLRDGRILIVGGSSTGNAAQVLATALIYDPAQNTFTAAGTLATPRMNHTATLLENGKVLIAGGVGSADQELDSTELFELGAGFGSGPALTSPRGGHTATLLPDGAILVAGGDTSGSAQLYVLNAAGDAWESSTAITPGLHVPRTGHTATLLPDGNVLIAGGENLVPMAVATTEMYDARSNSFVALTGTLDGARAAHSATLLNDGRLFVTGGLDDSTPTAVMLDGAAFYTPAFDPQGTALITSDSAGGSPVDIVSPSGACALSLTGTGTASCTGSVQPGHASADPHVISGAFTASAVAPVIHSSSTGNANLTVNKVVPTITWPTPADIAYGTPLALAGQLNAEASVAGDFVYDPPADTVLTPGVWQLSVQFTPNDPANYETATKQVSLTVTTRNLTITGLLVGNKTYDRTTAATLHVSGAALDGIVGTDNVDLNSSDATAAFADKAAGANKPVNISGFALSGPRKDRYTLSQPSGVTATIFPKNLPVTGVTAVDKVYNGNTNAPLDMQAAAIPDVITEDDVSLNKAAAAGAFADKNVGAHKDVTVTGFAISGLDAANYTLVQPTGLKADITAKDLNVTGVKAGNKTYDGTLTATLVTSDAALSVVENGDDVILATGGAIGAFLTKIAEVGKEVTVSGLTISGLDAGNYTLHQPSGVTATILPKDVNVVGVTAVGKVYNGNANAPLAYGGASLDGVLPGDHADLNTAQAAGAFANKNVGTNKPITTSGFAAEGADAANYHVVQPAGLSATITALDLTGQITVSNKPYDLTTNAEITARTLATPVEGDEVSYIGGTATFSDPEAGDNKLVTVTGLSLTGGDAANYTVNTTATTHANIQPRPLEGSITAAGKIYDGTATATITGRTLVGVLDSDEVEYVGGTATFDSKNAGTNKDVTATGLSLAGAKALNYSVNTTATTKANIAPKAVVGSITVSNKVYDSNPNATIATRSLEGVVVVDGTPDDVSYSGGTATFENEHVGAAISVSATGLTLTGADAGNYTVNSTATVTAEITAAPLLITATGTDRVYDGTTQATVSLSDNRMENDELSTSYSSASFADKTAGVDKPVTVSGIATQLSDSVNYTANTGATATARIAPLPITGEITAGNKVYDGTTTATIGGHTLHGVLSPDVVTLTGDTAAFSDKNVGTNKTVTATGLTLSGPDASNYTTSSTLTATASITPAPSSTKVNSAAGLARDGSYQLTATVGWQHTSEIPPGSVTFSDGGTSLQTVTVDAAGHATTSVLSLPLSTGAHNIKAAYTPDASLGKNFSGSEATMVIVVSAPVSTQPGRVLAQPVSVTTAGGMSGVQCRVDSLAPVPPPTTLFPACDVNPKSVGAGTSTLTVQIQTVAGTSARLHKQTVFFYAMWLVAGLAFLPLGAASRASRRHRRLLSWLGVVLLAAVFCLAVGCGGGFNNPQSLQPNVGGAGATQPGQYVIVITASDSPSSSVVLASVPVNVQY